MTDFGAVLRELRVSAGMRQADLAQRLGGKIARSTLANVEAGRQPATERMWAAIESNLPDWIAPLQKAYERDRRAARRPRSTDELIAQLEKMGDSPLGGPFFLESVSYTYIFRDHRSPEEILEVRRVRALRSGADSYGLLLTKTDSEGFGIDQESLWGGQLVDSIMELEEPGRSALLRRFQFDRPLRKNEVHEFAVRAWVERDPTPGRAVTCRFTVPVREAQINLNFHGPRPRRLWEWDSSAAPKGAVAEDVPTDESVTLDLVSEATVTRRWMHPELHVEYGIGWAW